MCDLISGKLVTNEFTPASEKSQEEIVAGRTTTHQKNLKNTDFVGNVTMVIDWKKKMISWYYSQRKMVSYRIEKETIMKEG